MTRMLSRSRTLAIAACLTILALPALRAQDTRQQGAPAFVSAKALAEQLGAKLQPRDDDELRVGVSFTAVLASPEKLTALGLKEMHAGARITVGRIAPDKIRVEADEMEPVPASTAATLKLDAKGMLLPAAK
jgi:hypothetical protein